MMNDETAKRLIAVLEQLHETLLKINYPPMIVPEEMLVDGQVPKPGTFVVVRR